MRSSMFLESLMYRTNAVKANVFFTQQGGTFYGTIHSVYDHAVNVRFKYGEETRLLTLFPESEPRTPDCILLKNMDFTRVQRLQPGWNAMITNAHVVFEVAERPTMPDILEVVFENDPTHCLLKSTGQIDPEAIRTMLKRKAPIEGLKNTASAMIIMNALERYGGSGNPLDVLDHVGFGAGLSPAADDAIVGITAVLQATSTNNSPELQTGPGFSRADFYELFRRLDGSTTDLGLKFMMTAFYGEFIEPVLDLMNALQTGKNVDKAADRLAAYGGSTGKSMLQGVIIGLENL